jgi:hypothetical protein
LKAQIADPESHITKSNEYNVKFSVITFNEVFESSRSESRPPLPLKSKPNSLEALTQTEESKELAWSYLATGEHAPYSVEFPEPSEKIEVSMPNSQFQMSMVRIKDASLQIKVYEDTKQKERRKSLALTLSRQKSVAHVFSN